MTTKTVIDLMREYVRVSGLCDAYNKANNAYVKPWDCVRLDGELDDSNFDEDHPKFIREPEAYQFAVAILEGRGVFVGDEIYDKSGLDAPLTVKGPDHLEYAALIMHTLDWSRFTWRKPTPKRTFKLNVVELPCPVADRLDEDYALDIGRKFVYWFRSREDRDAVLHVLKNILDGAKND